MRSNKENIPPHMRKCPDEKTLAGYLDYRLPSKEWEDVRGHCYFCKECQKVVRSFVEATNLRRQRLGGLENKKEDEILETFRLGLLASPPNDPKWVKLVADVKKRVPNI